MNNFIKENCFKLSIIIVILFIFGASFYWYEWRPSQIKKECYKEATEEAINLTKTKAEISNTYKEFAEKNMFRKDDFESYYKGCLKKKGL